MLFCVFPSVRVTHSTAMRSPLRFEARKDATECLWHVRGKKMLENTENSDGDTRVRRQSTTQRHVSCIIYNSNSHSNTQQTFLTDSNKQRKRRFEISSDVCVFCDAPLLLLGWSVIWNDSWKLSFAWLQYDNLILYTIFLTLNLSRSNIYDCVCVVGTTQNG